MGINRYRNAGLVLAAAFVAGLAHGEYGETALFDNIKFKHSIGLITKEGHEGTDLAKYTNWDIWDEYTGRLKTTYDEITKKLGILMPEYRYLTHKDDPRITPTSIIDDSVEEGEGVRRPTHVTEHTLYAIPGEKIYLYPFTDFGDTHDRYHETFTRWYDYSTDKKSPFIAFDNEFSDVIETEYGTVGGKSISAIDNTFIIENVEDYFEFVKRVNFGDVNLCAEITAKELDFGPYNKTKDLSIGSKDRQNGKISVTITYDNEGNPLDPIGFYNKNLSGNKPEEQVFFTYTGTFNGNGRRIKNLHINRYVEDGSFVYNQKLDVGMFGRVGAGARIYGLRIDDSCEFIGQERVGFIGGVYEDSKYDAVYIENVINHGEVTADWKLGWSSKSIEGGEYAGGIFGGTQGSTDIFVRNCAATGTVKGYDGSIDNADVKDGKVTFSDPAVNVGGLAGFTGNNAMLDKDDNPITDGDPSKLIKADGSVRLTSVTAFKNCYTVAKDYDGNFLPLRGNGNIGAIRLFDSYDPTRTDVKDYSINFWKDEDKKINDKYYPYYYKGLYNCYSPVQYDSELHRSIKGDTIKGYDHFDLEHNFIEEENHSSGMRKMGWYAIPYYTIYPEDLATNLNEGNTYDIWKNENESTNAPTLDFTKVEIDTSLDYTEIKDVEGYKDFVEKVNNGQSNINAKLTDDLNFSGHTDIEPIGTKDNGYNGVFEGNGHTISNLHISKTSDNVGMFGYLAGQAQIRNLVIDTSCKINGNNYVGFIGAIGDEKYPDFIIIENIINNGNVSGNDNVGGIYGGRIKDTHVIVNNCASTGTISALNTNVGGIAGWTGYNKMTESNMLDKNTWPKVTVFSCCFTTAKNNQGKYLPLRGDGNLGAVWITSTSKFEKYQNKYPNIISEKWEDNLGWKSTFKGLYNCWSTIEESEKLINGQYIDYFGSFSEEEDPRAWNHLEANTYGLNIPDNLCEELNSQYPKGFEPEKLYQRVNEINWEDDSETSLPAPTKTAEDNIIHSEKIVVKIATVDDYLEFARRVNENHETNLDAELIADLDFSSVSNPPMIGEYKAHCYNGTFDGKGHTISNLKIDRPTQGVVGMFGWVCGGAMIANLTLDESCLIRGMNTVGLAASLQPSNAADKVRLFNLVMKGTVEGVETITNGVSDGEGYDIGGIIGKRGGTNVFVTNCASLGTVKGRNVCTGAIAGHTGWNEWNMTVFENCLANAKGNYGEPLPLRANGNLGGTIKLTFKDFRIDDRDSAVEYRYVEDDPKPHQYVYQGIINCWSAIGEASSDISLWFDDINNAKKMLVEKRFTEVRDDNNKFVQGSDIFDDSQLHALPDNMKSTAFAEQLGEEWNYISTEDKPEETPLPDVHKVRFNPTRQGGAVATFLIPENLDPETVFNADGELYIALDISQTYSQERNLKENEDGGYTLIEPIVAFRHIFTIKDARKFADEYSSTKAKNEEYISERRRHVSARAGDEFQIRLEFTVPTKDHTEGGRKYETLSSRYYKESDGVYKRFSRCRLEAWENKDGSETLVPGWDYDNQKDYMFHFDEAYDAPDGEYWRMITCSKEKAKAGRYILKVFALDKDGNDIIIPDGSGEPLQLTEFDITLLDAREASFIPDDEIYDYDNGVIKFDEDDIRYRQTEEYLEENYTKLAWVDFDQYLEFQKALEGNSYKLEDGTEITTDGLSLEDFFQQAECRYDEYEKENNEGLYFFKWPEPWGTSSYGFGYNERREYSMYLVTNSAVPTPYHSAAHKRGTPFFDRNYHRERFKAAQEEAKKDEESNGVQAVSRAADNSSSSNEVKDFDKGYFYYLNAAGDPGTITEFEIDELCPGATLYVSAWVAELTATGEPTTANVIFNFNAIMKDGTSKTLHSYVSGSVAKDSSNDFASELPESSDTEQRGKWMHVYYQFVPNYGSMDRSKIDHYELQLENNARNSHGADYAVDDVRVYGANLKVSARQNEPYCYTNTTKVQVGINHETLLASMGIMEADTESGDMREIYYTFLDKEKYDAIYNNEHSDAESGSEIVNVSKEAFENAVLKYEYDGEESGVLPWGKIRVYTKYSENPEKPDNIADNIGQVWRDVENSENEGLVMFHTNPYDRDMMPEKEYIIALYLPSDNSGDVSWSDFEIYGLCARATDFEVIGSLVVLEDGVAVPTKENISCCANQTPYIQVDLNVFHGDQVETEYTANVDWYDGSREEFDNESMAEGESLYIILKRFRQFNPEFDGVDWTAGITLSTEQNAVLNQEMVDYLKGLQDNGKLRLHQNFFVFRHKKECEHSAIVAIPIDKYDVDYKEYDDVLTICTEPLEIPVTYLEPGLNHGFADIAYPEAVDSDVPLRIGLKQIDLVSYSSGNNTQDLEGLSTLAIPLRGVSPAADGVSDLQICMVRDFDDPTSFVPDPEVLLVGTDDDAAKALIGTTVGYVEGIKAHLYEDGVDELGKNRDNTLYLTFRKDAPFREGYSYSLQFSYADAEAPATVDDSDQADADDDDAADNDEEQPTDPNLAIYAVQPPCGGFHVMTLKVVPEYQKWTAGEDKSSADWNDDANWSRVTSADLYRTSAADKTGYEQFTSDLGANENTNSFMPLEFTKVIVDPGVEMPVLYEAKTLQTVKTADEEGNVTSRWEEWPQEVKSISNVTETAETAVEETAQYDMVAFYQGASYYDEIKPWNITETNVPTGVACRPWYMNTCEQIHFRPETEIGKQRLLTYQKAWVDMETEEGRWHTLASPLQEVYAGDMYLPTEGARQVSPLFEGITYDESINHRFRPAVYQRGWNKATASVYEITKTYEGDTPDELRNVAVAADWSNVFNEVKEQYGEPGTGFSIKADVAKAENFDAEKGTVLFRLPKDDVNFKYYSEDYDGDTDKSKHDGDVARTPGKAYRLHEVPAAGFMTLTAEVGNEGKFFLVGNPFMSHLDMQKFLTENSDVIHPKYWIMNGDSQQSAVMDEISEGFVGGIENAGLIAPLQGFFVESKTDVSRLQLRCSEEMSVVNAGRGAIKAPTRATDTPEMLRITAMREGSSDESAAFIVLNENASNQYNPAEDAALIDDSEQRRASRVYTIAGNMASSVNQIRNLSVVEVGLFARNDAQTTLQFENVGAIGDAILHDALLSTDTPLSEGMTVTVDGPVRNRLFITSAVAAPDEDSFRVNIERGTVSVYAPGLDSIEVNVYNPEGRLMKRASGEDGTVTFSVPKGVWLLDIRSESCRAFRKVCF